MTDTDFQNLPHGARVVVVDPDQHSLDAGLRPGMIGTIADQPRPNGAPGAWRLVEGARGGAARDLAELFPFEVEVAP